MFTAELQSWLYESDPKKFPYAAVVGHYHKVGKHFVDSDLLRLLAEVRNRLPAMRGSWGYVRTLASFLNTALDKADDCYDYPSYLALCLLDLPTVRDPIEYAEFAQTRCDRLIVQLMSDVLLFEVAAMDESTTLLPNMRPVADEINKRCKHGLRSIRPALMRLSLDNGLTATTPAVLARQVGSLVQADMSFSERRTMELSMLPVYTVHDEYMFLRVLQMFETTFALVVVHLRVVAVALARREIDRAMHGISVAERAIRESAPLFSMLATMRPESFRAFRVFTEGASAIQSRNYKLVESLCREPDRERLDSLAYRSVPEVRSRVLTGQSTLDDAYLELCNSSDIEAQAREQLDDGMRRFARALQRWRHTHYRLARRTLGEAPGTGFTDGIPYLDSGRKIPVFRGVGEDETGAKE